MQVGRNYTIIDADRGERFGMRPDRLSHFNTLRMVS